MLHAYLKCKLFYLIVTEDKQKFHQLPPMLSRKQSVLICMIRNAMESKRGPEPPTSALIKNISTFQGPWKRLFGLTIYQNIHSLLLLDGKRNVPLMWAKVSSVSFSDLSGDRKDLSILGRDRQDFPSASLKPEECADTVLDRQIQEGTLCDGNSDKDGSAGLDSPENSALEFDKVDVEMLPTIVLIGRPNVGKSALFNRLIRRREALVHNTPDSHMTRDIREGVAKLGDLRFKVVDSAGLEREATSGSVLARTARLTANVIERSHMAIFLFDARSGLHPLDLEVGKWLRKHASNLHVVLVMNKAEGIYNDFSGTLLALLGEAHTLGFGDAIPISAETGEGMSELYEAVRPPLEGIMERIYENACAQEANTDKDTEDKLPLQLAIVGRPNVGKSTLLNALLLEEHVLTGPEPGLTRDSVRVEFEFEGRTIYLVDTAGWLQRSKIEEGPAALSAMHARRNIMRAQIVAMVLDGEKIAKEKRSMHHSEASLARWVVEEGRGLVVVVNKMDLLKGKENAKSRAQVMKAVPEEIQTILPQVTGIPVVFISALEGKGRAAVMKKIIESYDKWCFKIPTSQLNRWLRKVMARHSWKDQGQGAKVKYMTQVKARPPTFVAFIGGSAELSETDLRFLTNGLKEDFNLGGIPLRIFQRSTQRKSKGSPKVSSGHNLSKSSSAVRSDKRDTISPPEI